MKRARYAPNGGRDSGPLDGVKRVLLRDRRHLELVRLADSVIVAALACALIAYMLLGNFTRYVADDYGVAVAVRLRGYWAQQIAAYRFSDGHFVATALYTAGALLNPIFVRILPVVLILAWIGLLLLALRHLIPAAGRLGRLLIASGIVYTTLQLTPSPFLSVYWMTASLEFVVPLLLAAIFVWLISRPGGRGRRRTLRIALIGLAAFLAAGEAEIYTAAQSVALTIAVAVVASGLSPAWREKLPELGAAWVGSLVGLAVELASPGKVIRSADISKLVHVPRPSLLTLPLFTLGQMLHFLQTVFQAHWREMVAMALLVALIGSRSRVPPRVVAKAGAIAVAVAICGFLLVLLAALAPAAFYYGGLPPLWDQIIPIYVCVCGVAVLGWAMGRSLRAMSGLLSQRVALFARFRRAMGEGVVVIVGALVAIGPIATVVAIGHELPGIQAYAATKDAQAAAAEAARAAGNTSAIVPPLSMVENLGIFSHPVFEDLMSDPDFWINVDEAQYYGIKRMSTSP